jgi:hypothetical protein
VNHQGVDPQLIDALSGASSLQLFLLSTLIERMLADPRRISAVRMHMHLGQTVRFRQVTVHEVGTRREWKLPYAAIEPPAPDASTAKAQAAAPLPPPKPGRNDFRCGEKVSFEDRYLQTQVGTVVRINQRTASVDTGDGQTWRVPFALLRHVLDI